MNNELDNVNVTEVVNETVPVESGKYTKAGLGVLGTAVVVGVGILGVKKAIKWYKARKAAKAEETEQTVETVEESE